MTQQLLIRNVGLATYTAIELNQTPAIFIDNNNVVFAFDTDKPLSQLQLQYKNSTAHRVIELSIQLSAIRKNLLKQHKD